MNLKMLRESGMTKRLVDELNTTKYMYPEQDVFNLFCRGKIKELPSYYGRSAYTEPCSHPKVVHYAATMGKWKNYILVDYYRNIPFSEIRKDEFNEDLDSSADVRNNIAGDI